MKWEVLDGDDLVLEVEDHPGALRSTAPLAPGAAPAQHPFLTATARDAGHEHKLRQILLGSTTVDDYLERLGDAGYIIRAT